MYSDWKLGLEIKNEDNIDGSFILFIVYIYLYTEGLLSVSPHTCINQSMLAYWSPPVFESSEKAVTSLSYSKLTKLDRKQD